MPRNLALLSSVIISAFLFAAAHFPAILAFTDPPPLIYIVFAGGGNFFFGVLFGVMLWRNLLESAMVSHAAAHIGMVMAPTVP